MMFECLREDEKGLDARQNSAVSRIGWREKKRAREKHDRVARDGVSRETYRASRRAVRSASPRGSERAAPAKRTVRGVLRAVRVRDRLGRRLFQTAFIC